METNPFQLFIELVTFDQKIVNNENHIKKLEKEISDLTNEINSLQANLNNSKEIYVAAHKEVDAIELKMKELDQIEKNRKKKLEESGNPKEYTTLKKEIEKIKQTQFEIEPKLVESWNKLETTKKEYETKKVEFENKIKAIQDSIDQKNKQIETIEDELTKLEEERSGKEKGIPEEWIAKYNIMHKQVKNPVVPVISNSCSACFYTITSQDMIYLKNKRLLQCKRCYRFLYLPEQHN
jgi:predicted  nucleic acid-binding Zn-ribbon protein